MVLDECLAHPVRRRAARASMERTLRWARRARERLSRAPARRGRRRHRHATRVRRSSASCRAACSRSCARRARARPSTIGFEAYAIGGLSVGEPTDVMYDIVGRTTPCLPADRPRYLMGAARRRTWWSRSPGASICSTACCRRATRGTASSSRARGAINIKNARYAEDDRPPDPACGCYTCRTCSRAYLRHLFMAGEINACTLNTLHNLHFYLDTLRRIRDAIVFRRFESFRLEFRQSLSRQPDDS